MNIQERVWKIGALVGILLAVFLATISVKEMKSIGYVGKSDNQVNVISVNGKGEQLATPDIATFSFTVSETAKTVAEAQDKASVKSNSALKIIKDAGVADKDIKTTSYNINPHYEYQNGVCTVNGCPPSKSILTGYEVSQTTEVKVRDLSKAGDILSSIGSVGVQNVNGLSFSVDKMDDVKAKARKLAIDDAQSRARELAKQLGVTIIRITSYYDSSDNGPMPYYGMGGDAVSARAPVMEKAVAPEVSTGEQKVVSNVIITYEIK